MFAMLPHCEVPGDNKQDRPVGLRANIMARSGSCVGMTEELSVWRFGFLPGSESATAYGVAVDDGQDFVWVLATRKTGKVKEIARGWAIQLPDNFRTIMQRDSL